MLLSSSVLSLIMMGQSAAGQAARAEEQLRLEQCIAKIHEDAAEAYEDGLAWVNEGGRPFARQCTALALVELGLEAEGAVRLEDLANAANGGSIAQRVIYLTQSGNAWLLAGKPEAALVTLDNALRLSPNDPNLFADRASAFIALERWEDAERDLDFALQSLARDDAVLRMRAEARLQLGDLVGARRDMRDAMAIDGRNIQTLNLRGRIRIAESKDDVDVRETNVSPIIIIDD